MKVYICHFSKRIYFILKNTISKNNSTYILKLYKIYIKAFAKVITLNSELLIGNVTTIEDTTFEYNSFTKTGLYYINGPKNQSESDNKPGENITNCFMLVLAKSDYRCFQIIFPGNTESIFYRSTKTDSSKWNSWKTL